MLRARRGRGRAQPTRERAPAAAREHSNAERGHSSERTLCRRLCAAPPLDLRVLLSFKICQCPGMISASHLGREVAAPKSGQLWRRKSRPIPGGGVWAHFGGGRQYIFAKCATDDTEANNPSFKARRGAAPILSESALIRDLELRSASRCCSPLCGSRGFHKPLRRSRPLRFSPQSKLARVSPIPKGGCMSPRCQ